MPDSDMTQQFREMMERFEYRPLQALTDSERFYRLHGCSPRTYIDRCEGLVPLKQKPEPQREVPAITADAYAAMKRFA